jgi:hypothetical protein
MNDEMLQWKSSRSDALFGDRAVPLSSKSWNSEGWLNVLTQVVPASPRATASLGRAHGINRTDTNDGLEKGSEGWMLSK